MSLVKQSASNSSDCSSISVPVLVFLHSLFHDTCLQQCFLSLFHCWSFGYREELLAQISSRSQQNRQRKGTLKVKLEIVICGPCFLNSTVWRRCLYSGICTQGKLLHNIFSQVFTPFLDSLPYFCPCFILIII